MRDLHVDDRVRLLDDVPETELVRGRTGVVCSQWQSAREPLYEVEFGSSDEDGVRRLLLRPSQIEYDFSEVAVD